MEHRKTRPPVVATNESDLHRETAAVAKLLVGKTVRNVWRHRSGEVGIEFTDGSRIFINRVEEGLELSVE